MTDIALHGALVTAAGGRRQHIVVDAPPAAVRCLLAPRMLCLRQISAEPLVVTSGGL
jgi:hypothetical protein